MVQYDVYSPCVQCGGFHDLLVRVEIEEWFHGHTLSEALEQKLLPQSVLTAIEGLTCPKTGGRVPLPPACLLVLVGSRWRT